ncbi:MAG TPA: prepilin-type N-terminal cleavage/methylation domain-containing protein [Terriglobales bacterium]|nr:prepilin-type N-terminal cleavage/methylation domain-containing protein [Terriglobales bacterium]
MTTTQAFSKRVNRGEQGFTLLECLISMVVLTVGLISLLAVLTVAMTATQTSGEDAIAKKLAQEAVESIYSARDTTNVTWSQIENVGSGGIFVAGLQAINQPGVDGIIGTADDSAALPQVMETAGNTGVYAGTCPPDNCTSLTNFQRSITIADVADPSNPGNPYGNLRQLTVTVQYTTPQFKLPKTYSLVSYISQYK